MTQDSSKSSNYIAVLTTSQVEYLAACKFLEHQEKIRLSKSPLKICRATMGIFDDHSIIIACSLEPGNYVINSVLTAALEHYAPALVVLVGIGGGIPLKTKVGNVVISDYIGDHTYTTETESATIHNLDKGGPIRSRLIEIANEVEDQDDWKTRIKPPSITPEEMMEPLIMIGRISGGNVKVTTDKGPTVAVLENASDETLAIDMESAACYATSFRYDTPFISVRGISDNLFDKDPITDKYRQPWAAAHACATAFEIIHKYIDSVLPKPIQAEINKVAKDMGEENLAISFDLHGELEIENPSWSGVSTLLRFGKLPKPNRGEIVHLRVKFSGVAQTTNEGACEALSLEYGATVEKPVILVQPQMPTSPKFCNFDFLSKLYASWELATWLDLTRPEKTYAISVRLEFGSYVQKPFQLPGISKKQLQSQLDPIGVVLNENSTTRYLAGMVLVAGKEFEPNEIHEKEFLSPNNIDNQQ